MDAPAAEVTLSPDDVRRMTLRAQGFLGATSWHRSRAGVTAMLGRVGAVQLDTISVLARSHELVPYARLGPVSRQVIEQAYWHASRPAAFEYWAHAACVLPLGQWPYFAFRRRAFRARGVRWHQVTPETCEKVLARLRAEGPLTATQLGGAKGGGPWWDWSDVKIAVEWLLDTGEVICVRRTGWRRVYDLPERVLPDELLGAEPSDAECLAHLAGVTARALGVVAQADLTEYHRLNVTYAPLLADAAMAAGLTPVAIEGPAGVSGFRPGWADPAALAEEAAGRRGRHRVTLLSPFDSWSGTASGPGRCSASRTLSRPTCPSPSGCTATTPCPCSPAAAWPAGPIRPGTARPWSPGRYPWIAPARPSPWPRPCGRQRRGSAATTSASSESSPPRGLRAWRPPWLS
jgi:hypothetical protein